MMTLIRQNPCTVMHFLCITTITEKRHWKCDPGYSTVNIPKTTSQACQLSSSRISFAVLHIHLWCAHGRHSGFHCGIVAGTCMIMHRKIHCETAVHRRSIFCHRHCHVIYPAHWSRSQVATEMRMMSAPSWTDHSCVAGMPRFAWLPHGSRKIFHRAEQRMPCVRWSQHKLSAGCWEGPQIVVIGTVM